MLKMSIDYGVFQEWNTLTPRGEGVDVSGFCPDVGSVEVTMVMLVFVLLLGGEVVLPLLLCWAYLVGTCGTVVCVCGGGRVCWVL
jgi:hypothetical protein